MSAIFGHQGWQAVWQPELFEIMKVDMKVDYPERARFVISSHQSNSALQLAVARKPSFTTLGCI
jgi:hypothetical protein